MPQHLNDFKESKFPRLRKDDYCVTSNHDFSYNCVAHAADVNDIPWWPMPEDTEGVYWPDGVSREETVEAFIEAFKTRGYMPSTDNSTALESGIQKVAIFVGKTGEPTHAAKQLPSGSWTSKLGDWEDIEHVTLKCLESVHPDDEAYGTVAKVLTRKAILQKPITQIAKNN